MCKSYVDVDDTSGLVTLQSAVPCILTRNGHLQWSLLQREAVLMRVESYTYLWHGDLDENVPKDADCGYLVSN